MKRDLEKYLASLSKQREEMLKAVEEANKLIVKGEIDQNQVEMIQRHFNQVEANYQRVLYCRYLYNLPPKFIQVLQKKKLEKEMKKLIEMEADKESVMEENENCIDSVKEVIGDE